MTIFNQTVGRLFGNNPQRVTISRDEDNAPALTIDAVITSNMSRSVTTTENPIENGATITDHAQLGNIAFDMEVVVSEAPLPYTITESALGILAGIAGGAIGTEVGGDLNSLLTAGAALAANAVKNEALSPNVSSGEKTEQTIASRTAGDTDYPKKAYEYLMGMQQDRTLLRIKTRFKELNNMLITDVSNPRKIDDGKSFRINISFKQLGIIYSSVVDAPEIKIAKDAVGAATKSNLGKQAGSTATDSQTSAAGALKSRDQSILFRLFN